MRDREEPLKLAMKSLPMGKYYPNFVYYYQYIHIHCTMTKNIVILYPFLDFGKGGGGIFFNIALFRSKIVLRDQDFLVNLVHSFKSIFMFKFDPDPKFDP